MKIGVIGECMIELSQQQGMPHLGFGGDTLNTALYLARLLPRAEFEVAYVTALGCDPYSAQMLQAWQQEGIHTELVQQLENKLPGLYSIFTDAHGERSFYYWRNDSAAKYWLQTAQSAVILERLLQFDVLYLSGVSLAILDEAGLEKLFHFLPHFKARGGRVAFDNNYRPALWSSMEEAQAAYRQILAFTDVAFLTLDDEEKLWGTADVEACLARTQEFGVAEIVLKCGAQPCVVASQRGRFEIPAQKITHIVDTTAAGDSFSAGYLAARVQGADEIEAAQAGHRLAGEVIQHRGAIIPLADWQAAAI